MTDHEILTKLLKYSNEEAVVILDKINTRINDFYNLKLQLLAQNPALIKIEDNDGH